MEYDLGIVLSHEIGEEGTLSLETIARTEKGVRYLNEGVFKQLVLSGGNVFGYKFSIAQKMRDYAQPMTSKRIITEEISLDTSGQLVFLKEGIIDPRKAKSIGIVTSDWHLPKTEFMAYNLFDESYDIRFFSVDTHDLNRRRKDFLKIPLFLKTFRDFLDGKEGLLLSLLKNHPFYNGGYPWKRFEQDYFLKRLEELKKDNFQPK